MKFYCTLTLSVFCFPNHDEFYTWFCHNVVLTFAVDRALAATRTIVAKHRERRLALPEARRKRKEGSGGSKCRNRSRRNIGRVQTRSREWWCPGETHRPARLELGWRRGCIECPTDDLEREVRLG